MAERTIDIILNMETNDAALASTNKRVKELADGFKKVEQQANKTREQMAKLAQVGQKMALVGGAIVAPFALAMKKYVDTMGKTEGTSARILELQKEWENSQIEIGRVTAEIVLPALETALKVVKQISAFAKDHPDAVKAALGIGGTLIVLGGMLSTAASIVSTIATVQGLVAGVGTAMLPGGALAAGGAAGVGASLAPVVAALAPLAAIAAAVIIAAEGTRLLVNWALGTNTTWSGIWETLKQFTVIAVEGWKLLFKFLGQKFSDFGTWLKGIPSSVGNYINNGVRSIVNGIGNFLSSMGQSLYTAISNMAMKVYEGIKYLISFLPGKAAGGYAGAGIYKMGERGHEFVMNHATTRAAERMMGGQLTQDRLLSSLAGGRNINYNDHRRIDSRLSSSDRRVIRNDVMTALAEGL